MNFLETISIFICSTLAIFGIMVLMYSAGRVFVSGMFHQIAAIVKKIDGKTERKENK